MTIISQKDLRMGWLKPGCLFCLFSLTIAETLLRPHLKSQRVSNQDLFCAGDVNNVCRSGLCYDSINLLDQRIASGCATTEMCSKTECKLFETKFVCCCPGTYCNGKSASLLRSRLQIEQERRPRPPVFKIAKGNPRGARDVESEPRKEKMMEFVERDLSGEKAKEEGREVEEKGEDEVIKAQPLSEKKEEKEITKEKIQPTKIAKLTSEELPPYTPELATKGMPVKKSEPTTKKPTLPTTTAKTESLTIPPPVPIKKEELPETPSQEKIKTTNNETSQQDFITDRPEDWKVVDPVIMAQHVQETTPPPIIQNIEEKVEIKTVKPVETLSETTPVPEKKEEPTTVSPRPERIPLTEGPIGGVRIKEEETTTAALVTQEPILPPVRMAVTPKEEAVEGTKQENATRSETASSQPTEEKTPDVAEESHGADDVFFKQTESSERLPVDDAVVAGVKIQQDEAVPEKPAEESKPLEKKEQEDEKEKEDDSEERPELGVGAAVEDNDKSDEVKTEARPLSNKDSGELEEGEPLPAPKPKRTTSENPMVQASGSNAVFPALVILAMLIILGVGGFVLWRKKQANRPRRSQRQQKSTELVLVDPLLKQKEEKVANELQETPSLS